MAGAVVLVFSIGQLEKLVGYGIMLSMSFDADFQNFTVPAPPEMFIDTIKWLKCEI